jgi:hypothetical protein
MYIYYVCVHLFIIIIYILHIYKVNLYKQNVTYIKIMEEVQAFRSNQKEEWNLTL